MFYFAVTYNDGKSKTIYRKHYRDIAKLWNSFQCKVIDAYNECIERVTHIYREGQSDHA